MPRLHRVLFWLGVVGCGLSLWGVFAGAGMGHLLWLGTNSLVTVVDRSFQVTFFHAGELGFSSKGQPSYYTGSSPVLSVDFPLWYMLPVLAVFTGVAWAWGRRTPAWACPKCGLAKDCPRCRYSLEGLHGPACPECGWSVRAVPAGGRGKQVGRFLLRHAGLIVGVSLSAAIIFGMVRAHDSRRVVWLTDHSYGVLVHDVLQVAVFDGPGTLHLERGVPRGFMAGGWFRVGNIPLWLLLCTAAAATVPAAFWRKRLWMGRCAGCGFSRKRSSRRVPDPV